MSQRCPFLLTVALRRVRLVLAGLVLCVGLVGMSPAISALDIAVFSSWDTADGLPSAEVRDVYPDRFGRLWIATAEGLARWDGDTFEVLNQYTTPRINHSAVSRIREMPDGSVWVGDDRGITIFDVLTDRTRHFAVGGDDAAGSIPYGAITDFAPDASGDVWIASWGGGLMRWNAQSDRITVERMPDRSVNAVHVASDGTVVFGDGGDGLYRLTPDATVERLLSGVRIAPAGIVALDGQRILVAAEQSGAFICEDNGSDCETLVSRGAAQVRPRSAVQMPGGEVLVGGTGGVYSLATGELVLRDGVTDRCRLPHDVLMRLVADDDGRIWLGTRGGLALYDPAANLFQEYGPAGLSMCEQQPGELYVETISPGSDGSIWLGGQTTGPVLFRVADGVVTTPFSVEGLGSSVVTLHELPDRRLAVGTWGNGMWIGDPVSGRLEPVPALAQGIVRDIEAVGDGTIWVGNNEHIVRLDARLRVTGRFRLSGGPERRVSDLDLLQSGELAIASWTGDVSFLNPDTGVVRSVSVPGASAIIAVREGADGSLWLGTFGDGLFQVEPDGTLIRHLTAADGLPSELVMGTLADGMGRVWALTRGGLVQLDADGSIRRSFGAADGLIDTYVGRDAFVLDAAGRIWLGSTSGVATIRTDAVMELAGLPAPRVGSITVDGQRLLPDDERTGRVSAALTRVQLFPGDTAITFRVGVPGIWDLSGISFAYRLSGVSDSWTELPAGANDLTFSGLDPGEHRLELRAAGMRWETSAVGGLDLQVEPRWYERGVVQLLTLLAAAAAVVSLILLRDRAAMQRSRKLERVVAERTEEIRVERDRYSALSDRLEKLVEGRTAELQQAVVDRDLLLRELHHRVKNNMQIIASLLSLSESQHADPHETILQSQMRIQAMAMIHESLYRQDGPMSTVDFNVYVDQLAHSILSMQSGPRVTLRCEVLDQRVPMSIEKAVPLGMVVSEVLTNCFKHAFAGREQGTISVRFRMERGERRLVIEDDGVGMAPDSADGDSIGMLVIRNLAAQIGADSGFETGFAPDGGGTRFTITVPVAQAPAEEEGPAPLEPA